MKPSILALFRCPCGSPCRIVCVELPCGVVKMADMHLTEKTLRALRVVDRLPKIVFGKGYEWVDLFITPFGFTDEHSNDDVHHVDFKGRIRKLGSQLEPYRVHVGYVCARTQNDTRRWGREDINVMQVMGPTKVVQRRFVNVHKLGHMRLHRIDMTRA